MRTFLMLVALAMLQAISLGQESPHGPLKIACQACHSTDSWTMSPEATFDHGTTSFTLVGQHLAVACKSCHSDLKFAATSTSCNSCHADIHKSELGDNCLRCHTTQSWKISDMVQKHQQTRFTLLGKHSTVACEACHARASNFQYKGVSATCIGCHRTDYQMTLSPSHSVAGFSTDCASCHLVTALVWDRSFDHGLTGFPLTGAHRASPCSNCHGDHVYKGKTTQCVGCHQTDFNATLNPNHMQSGFSTDCMQCHTTTAWQPATFQHNATNFPLTGRHTTAQCQDCHVGNNYQLTYSSCYQCHQLNFEGTTNPNHVTGNFSHTCQTCHTTSAWVPSTFNHDQQYFRIYSGRHSQKWTLCSDCHTNPSNYAVYSCLNCHAHAQSLMDPKHSQESGYSYTSAACYSCHRRV